MEVCSDGHGNTAIGKEPSCDLVHCVPLLARSAARGYAALPRRGGPERGEWGKVAEKGREKIDGKVGSIKGRVDRRRGRKIGENGGEGEKTRVGEVTRGREGNNES